MAGAHDTEKKAFTMLLFAYITALEEEEDEQRLIQQRDQVARMYRRAVVRQRWVRPWLTEAKRRQFGHFSSLLDTQLRMEDPVAFQNYTRITPQRFDDCPRVQSGSEIIKIIPTSKCLLKFFSLLIIQI